VRGSGCALFCFGEWGMSRIPQNRYLQKAKNYDAERFTTSFGIRLRRFIHPLVHGIIRIATDKPLVVLQYPKLVKGQRYIFAAGHSFPGEIASNLAAIDRPTWVLLGTTDQVDHNPQMNIAWVNGLIYVNKRDTASRKESVKKMKRILNNGSSVLLFPEGVLNNSESLYCMPLYPGIYYMSRDTGAKVVPIVAQSEHKDNKIWIAAGEPLDFSEMDKETAIQTLRDALATLRYTICEQVYAPQKREELTGDLHEQHLKDRWNTYMEAKWHLPDWDEEIMTYRKSGFVAAEEVRAELAQVTPTARNAHILAPILLRHGEDQCLDAKRYMKEHWSNRKGGAK